MTRTYDNPAGGSRNHELLAEIKRLGRVIRWEFGLQERAEAETETAESHPETADVRKKTAACDPEPEMAPTETLADELDYEAAGTETAADWQELRLSRKDSAEDRLEFSKDRQRLRGARKFPPEHFFAPRTSSPPWEKN